MQRQVKIKDQKYLVYAMDDLVDETAIAHCPQCEANDEVWEELLHFEQLGFGSASIVELVQCMNCGGKFVVEYTVDSSGEW